VWTRIFSKMEKKSSAFKTIRIGVEAISFLGSLSYPSLRKDGWERTLGTRLVWKSPKGLLTWREEDPSSREILEGATFAEI